MRELLEKRRVNAAASEKVGSVVYVKNLVVAAAKETVGLDNSGEPDCNEGQDQLQQQQQQQGKCI